MQRKTLLTCLTALVLILGIVSPVFAHSYKNSIIYKNFNHTTKTSFQMPEKYTTMTADVTTHVNWNQSGTHIKVGFMNETTIPQGIWLFYVNVDGSEVTGILDIWYLVEPNEVKIATGTWYNGNTTRVILSNGYLTVICNYGEDNEATILKDFSFDKPLEYVQTTGASTYSLKGGYVQVNVNAGVGAMGGVITDWLPTIVSFALLGIVIGLVKKMAG